MRYVSLATQTAVEQDYLYSVKIKAEIKANHVYFDSIQDSHAPIYADPTGFSDSPIPETLSCNPVSGSLVTWYNSSGGLVYTKEGSSTSITVAQNISGNVGVTPDFGYLYVTQSDNVVHRYTIDGSVVNASGSNCLSEATHVFTSATTDIAVHAISGSQVVVICNDNGGLRAHYIVNGSGSAWADHQQTTRFMFPLASNDVKVIGKTVIGMLQFTSAVRLGSKVFVYVSNFLTGGVDCTYWDDDTLSWSDIETVVPCAIDVSLCEFRISNSFVQDDTVFIAGQFRRTETDTAYIPYSMILRSKDGLAFALDRYCLVAGDGYRYQSLVSNNNIIISHCNKVSRKDVTRIYSPISGSSIYTTEIPATGILDFSDSSLESASITLASGYEQYVEDPNIRQGSTALVYIGYGDNPTWELYGSYIVDAVAGKRRNGQRQFSLKLTNESIWNLTGLTSPFYSEVISKSSVNADVIGGDLYNAENSGFVENVLSVDFFQAEGFANSTLGTTAPFDGIETNLNTYFGTGNHKCAIKTPDLMESLGLTSYPKATSTTINVSIYGWSYDNTGGASNDETKCYLVCRTSGCSGSPGAEVIYSSGGAHFPCTYTGSTGGSYPITSTVTVPLGVEIVRVGVSYQAANSTGFYAHRVDMGNVMVNYEQSSATGWIVQSDNTLKLPYFNRPNIMFATKPYNSWNFKIASEFSSSIVGTFPAGTAYYIAVGVIGLAIDGSNYIAARYDYHNLKMQLVKVLDRVETILVSTTLASFNGHIMFEHTDGLFKINTFNKTTSLWETFITYEWKTADGYMTPNWISSKKVGIYGFNRMPYFHITSFDYGGDDQIRYARAIPIGPGYNESAAFPSTGKVRVNDTVYTYDGIVAASGATIRGPAQYRGINTNQTEAPSGDNFGIEWRDFDWTSSLNLAGRYIAIDDGFVQPIVSNVWQCWNTTNGQVVNLPGRARVLGPEIFNSCGHSTTNKVYSTGGLSNITLNVGSATWHTERTICSYHVEYDIRCLSFVGSSGDRDATLKDLINKISYGAGAETIFPGDSVEDSISITSSDWSSGTLEDADGCNIEFTITTPMTTGNYIDYKVNAVTATGHSGIVVRIKEIGSGYIEIYLCNYPSIATISSTTFYVGTAGERKVRILFHQSFVTVYINSQWATTFYPDEIIYPLNFASYLTAAVSTPVTDINFTELYDWREAVYIDLETDGNAALDSVIQERPIERVVRPDGCISYWYVPARETIVIEDHTIRQHDWAESTPSRAASDGIVYYANVKSIQYTQYAKNYGFCTRVYRMPNLSTGAVRAAKLVIRRALEEAIMHNITMRPNAKILVGDILDIDYAASGTGKAISFDVIVNSVDIQVTGGQSEMTITGREEIDG